MLLADYLKKPEQEKNLPPVAPSTAENTVNIPKPVWQQTPPPTISSKDTRSAEQVRENNPQSISDAYKLPGTDIVERLNSGEDVFKALLDRKYNDSKESIEKQRKAAFLGDLANLFGQTVASAQGARQFTPIQSKVPYYNEQLQRLKNWRNDADMNYSLSQAKNDYENKKYQQKLALDKYKMDVEQGRFGEKMKLEYARLAENVRKNKITQEQAEKKLAEMMRHNQATERTSSFNAESSRITANAAKERAKNERNGTNINESVVVSDSYGNKTAVTYSKEKRGAVLSLIGRMKQIINDRLSKIKDKNNREKIAMNYDDINLSVDTPDQMGRALTILQTRLQDFPELTDEFYKIIDKENSTGNVAPWKQTSNNNVAPYRK